MKKDVSKQTAADSHQRRTFLSWLWRVLAAAGVFELFWIIASLFSDRHQRSAPLADDTHVTLIDAGTIDEFKPGDVKAIPQGRFYLVCLEDGSFLALARNCTHLGCAVPWHSEEHKFICPCHGSTFDSRGVVMTPPALRPLDYFPVKIENGLIRVDVSRPLRRDEFTVSQTCRV